MLRSSLCDYSDAYTHVKGNLSVNNTAAAGAAANNENKKLIFKNCASFANFISKIKNAETDNSQYIDIVMPIKNLQSIVINIHKHLEAYGNIAKIYQL